MIRKLLYLAGIVSLLLLPGCIKELPANMEVDLIEVTILNNPNLHISYSNSAVEIYAQGAVVDPTNLVIDIKISQGATIAPDPAQIKDYSTIRKYTITSEDGKWSKDYFISLITSRVPLVFDFEHWVQPDNTRYKIPYEIDQDNRSQNIWASGNAAFAFVAGDKDYTAYPTQPVENFVKKGKTAVLLKTQYVGIGGRMLASGSLYIGQFDASKFDPLECTKFGMPFMEKPLRVKGWYKYRSAGKTAITSVDDQCNIQAVLYKTDAQTKFLNGYTIKNSPLVVGRAQLEDCTSTPGEEYIPFDIEFVYTQDVDYKLLNDGGYNLIVMFVSSREGSSFDGTVGSELYVDDVEIVCE